MPEGASAILDTRSLGTGNRRLAALLHPGLSVLDVGCGTGAITRGIAEAVGHQGRVVGVDVNASMIEKARAAHGSVPGLSFEVADVHTLPSGGAFDIVAADQHEVSQRADPDFEMRAGIWAAVAATRGHQMVADGAIRERERDAAEADYRAWLRDSAESHVQYLLAVEGVRT